MELWRGEEKGMSVRVPKACMHALHVGVCWRERVCVSVSPGVGRRGDRGKEGRTEKKKEKQKSTGKRRTEVFGYMI